MDWLLGSIKDAAKREYDNYDFEDGSRKQDFGDWLGDAIFRRKEAIDKAVQDLHVQRLTRAHGTELGELNSSPNVNIGPITATTDPTKLTQQIAVARPKKQAMDRAMEQAAVHDVVIDPSKITSPTAVYQTIASTKRQRQTDKEEKARAQTISDRDALWARQDTQKAEADKRYYGDRAEQRLATAQANELAHQRGLIELAQTKQRDAYEMQKYQHELAYRKEQAREKRTSNLIQALAGLGAAFAIQKFR